MIEIITLATNRYTYGIREAADSSITVGQLIDELRQYDEDSKIVLSNDGGYTYGYIDGDLLEMVRVKTEEEEEAEELRETMEELQEELTDLEARYTNPTDEDDVMTEEEYNNERQSTFDFYGISEEEYNNYKF